MKIKEQIVALRKKFGKDNWLHSAAGTFVQDIMGLQHAPGPLLSSSPVVITPTNTPVTSDSFSPNLKNSSTPLPEEKTTKIVNESKESEDREDEKEKTPSENSDSLVSDVLAVATVGEVQPESAYDFEEGELR